MISPHLFLNLQLDQSATTRECTEWQFFPNLETLAVHESERFACTQKAGVQLQDLTNSGGTAMPHKLASSFEGHRNVDNLLDRLQGWQRPSRRCDARVAADTRGIVGRCHADATRWDCGPGHIQLRVNRHKSSRPCIASLRRHGMCWSSCVAPRRGMRSPVLPRSCRAILEALCRVQRCALRPRVGMSVNAFSNCRGRDSRCGA